MVSVHFDDPSLNPADYFKFLFENSKINEEGDGVGPSLKKVPIGHSEIKKRCLPLSKTGI